MKRNSKIMAWCVVLIAGMSVALAACDETKSSSSPSPVPASTTRNLINTTISLTANSLCNGFDEFCYKFSFVPEAGKIVTINATSASNLNIALYLYDSKDNFITNQTGWGSSTLTFTPVQSSTYYLQVDDFSNTGGSVTVVATQ